MGSVIGNQPEPVFMVFVRLFVAMEQLLPFSRCWRTTEEEQSSRSMDDCTFCLISNGRDESTELVRKVLLSYSMNIACYRGYIFMYIIIHRIYIALYMVLKVALQYFPVNKNMQTILY